jgi:type IV pilus assembly protein PilN
MRFTINLATRTHLDPRLVNRSVYAALGLLLLLLAWNINRTAWDIGELRRLKSDITSYENKLNSRPSGVSEKDYTGLLTGIKFYNEIIGRKSFNWLGLLDKVEAATPEGVALSLLSPDRKSGEIKIEGHAKSFAQVRSYLEKLEDSKSFTSILLLSHADIAVGEKGRGVLFTVSCKAVLQ